VDVATQLSSTRNFGEQLLVQAGQRGEPQALDTLFHRHRNLLFHSALGITGNREDAEDALQDGLLCAFRSLKNFEGRAQFSTWLTRIVINAALMRRRSLLSRPPMTPLEPLDNAEVSIKDRLASNGMTPEQLFSRSEILAMTKEHIEALSPILRTVFVLRVMLEFTAKEAAEILDVPPNTVKARLWRARRQLAGRISRIHLSGIRSTHGRPVHAIATGAACD
jgi:RNA polymerase sigma-70 factor (ECF subfamily)